MPPSDHDKSSRCQVRISLSERDGRLWEWAQALPEKARARQMLHLMWLGLSAQEAISVKTSTRVGEAVGVGNVVPQDGASEEPAKPVGLRALAEFNVDAFNF
jgi:hypothetical protein